MIDYDIKREREREIENEREKSNIKKIESLICYINRDREKRNRKKYREI